MLAVQGNVDRVEHRQDRKHDEHKQEVYKREASLPHGLSLRCPHDCDSRRHVVEGRVGAQHLVARITRNKRLDSLEQNVALPFD